MEPQTTPKVVFTCERCGYYTNLRANLTQHENRKTKCKPKLRQGFYFCKFCEKQLGSAGSKCQHQKRCKLDPRARNTFLGVDTSVVTSGLLDALYIDDWVPDMITLVFFNTDLPENQTVRAGNTKTTLLVVNNSHAWESRDLLKTIREMVDFVLKIRRRKCEDRQAVIKEVKSRIGNMMSTQQVLSKYEELTEEQADRARMAKKWKELYELYSASGTVEEVTSLVENNWFRNARKEFYAKHSRVY